MVTKITDSNTSYKIGYIRKIEKKKKNKGFISCPMIFPIVFFTYSGNFVSTCLAKVVKWEQPNIWDVY